MQTDQQTPTTPAQPVTLTTPTTPTTQPATKALPVRASLSLHVYLRVAGETQTTPVPLNLVFANINVDQFKTEIEINAYFPDNAQAASLLDQIQRPGSELIFNYIDKIKQTLIRSEVLNIAGAAYAYRRSYVAGYSSGEDRLTEYVKFTIGVGS